MTALIGWLIALVFAFFEARYAFYWAFGLWLPWWVNALVSFAGPFVFPFWLVLWLMHFAPAVHWPLVR